MRLALSAALFAASCSLPVFAAPAATAPAGTPTVEIGSPVALTFYLPLTNLAAAESKAKSLQSIGSSDYHRFLTRPEFVAAYAPSDADIKAIEGSLENLGFTVVYVFANHLAIQVTGSVSTVESALGTSLKTVTEAGKTGIVPVRAITLPASLQGKIRGVGGLNTIHRAHPMLKASFNSTTRVDNGALTGGQPGYYLPADFEKFYGVDPVYNRGYRGRGTTIGIATLADFNPADAYAFWKQIGLNVSQTRITKVDVDGGTTAAKRLDGEGETDLDTEYSGAVAPEAKLRVYVAPNTNNGFTDLFEAVASENIADTVSLSWGEAELDYFANPVVQQPSETYLLDVFHEAFLEMALQGQTLYVSSGDSGSFQTEEECSSFGKPTAKTPVCNAPYAIDAPSNDPLVTSAGGTTLPIDFSIGDGISFYVPQQRAWSWDYIITDFAQQGYTLPLSEVFSVGGGGGVSSYFGLPWYQQGHRGMTKTVPGQVFTVDTGSGPVLDVTLPSNFAGRNTPDLSANADPESGYQLISEGNVLAGIGGTSFVAPQLNGVTALFVEALGTRVGQINPALYHLDYADTKDISAGDNWGYQSITGYDNAVGIGVLDAGKLLDGLLYLKSVK